MFHISDDVYIFFIVLMIDFACKMVAVLWLKWWILVCRSVQPISIFLVGIFINKIAGCNNIYDM